MTLPPDADPEYGPGPWAPVAAAQSAGVGRGPNPPRMPQIAFRVGRQASLRDWTMQRLAQAAAVPGGPLSRLTLEGAEDFPSALVSAWAAVGDNLAFYQERMAQEGFLRTATEDLSVRALNRSMGYAPRPPESARTQLAFTVLDAKGASASVQVPAGVAVQSVPQGTEPSVVFETDEAIEARSDWNALALKVSPPCAAPLAAGGPIRQLHVADGVNVRPGMCLVFSDRARSDAPQARIITDVDLDADGAAWLSWGEALAFGDDAASPDVWLCSRSARVFGAGAAAWSSVPTAVKAKSGTRTGGLAVSSDGTDWEPRVDGAPPADLAAVLDGPDDLFAAAADTVIRWNATALTWVACGVPAPRSTLRALAFAAHGRLFAGGDRGDVQVSVDGGRAWSMLPLSAPNRATRPPGGPVLALLAMESAGLLVAGGAAGVWTAPLAGGAWASWTDGLPGGGASPRMAETAVRRLRLTSRGEVLAATDAGLFLASDPGARWTRVVDGEARDVCGFGERGHAAAMREGVFSSDGEGRRWKRLPPLPGSPPERVAALGARLFAANRERLFVLEPGAPTWTPVSLNTDGPVAALEAAGGGLFVAQVFRGYLETEWPGLRLGAGGTSLDLDRAASTPGDWIVLADGADAACATAVRVRADETVTRTDFGLNARVTRLAVSGLPEVDPRTAQVLLGAAPVRVVQPRRPPPERLQGARVQAPGAAPRAPRLDGGSPDLAGRRVAISGQRPRVWVTATGGGVRRWDADAREWTQVRAAGEDVRALLWSARHGLIVGADDVTLEGGRYGATATPAKVRALAERDDGLIVALEAGLVEGVAGKAWSPLQLGAADMRGVAAQVDRQAAAATSLGVFLSDAPGAPWRPAPGWPADTEATAVVALGERRWAAGVGGGVALGDDGGWRTIELDPAGAPMQALAATGAAIYAASAAGMWTSPDAGATWRPSTAGGARGDVRALAAAADGTLWSAVRGEGVRRDGQLTSGGAVNDVRALVLDGQGRVHAGARSGAALLRVVPTTGPELATSLDLASCDDGRLEAWLEREGPLAADFVKLLEDLGQDVSAKAVLVRNPGEPGATVEDPQREGLQFVRRADGGFRLLRRLEVGLVTLSEPDDDGAVSLTLAAGGARVTLSARPEEIVHRSAAPDGEAIAEVALVASAKPTFDRDGIDISFAGPLANIYDASTVVLNANVASASHGESLAAGEIMGDGDSGRASQTFTLKSKPITRLHHDGDAQQHPAYALEVRVRTAPSTDALSLMGQLRPEDLRRTGQLWCEVANFDRSGPLDVHYVVTEGDDGAVSVTFGDGVRGRRLPTGSNNVVALCRVGAGAGGNVAAGALTRLKQRPPGLKKVANPTAATGGAAGEDVGLTRAMAPIRARALSRVVSLRDLEGFALAQPGIAKALVSDLRASGQGLVLTLASESDRGRDPQTVAPVPDFAPLLNVLQNSAARRLPLSLLATRLAWFDVEADVTLDAAVRVSQAEVDTQAQAAVRAAFGFDARTLGAPVRAAAVLAALQSVPGVAAVELTALQRRGWTRTRTDRLDCEGVSTADRKPSAGAELLLIGDVTLNLMAAPERRMWEGREA